MLIAGMVVLGIALEKTGLAANATRLLVGSLDSLQPFWALVLLYGATLLLTELISNATVAVLVTPVAVALGEQLAVSPRPFVVAVMMAASVYFSINKVATISAAAKNPPISSMDGRPSRYITMKKER